MAEKKEPVAEYVHHTGPSTHEELEKRGVTDVLQLDQLILAEAILNVYATVTDDREPLRSDSKQVEAVSAFVCELSKIHDGVAFFSQLEGLATIMRGERACREVCGAAIRMLRDKGVTRDDFEKFVRNHCKEK